MDPCTDYAAYYRFTQRPFSLTPDPKFYFRSRSHARVFDALSAAIARRESVVLVLGDLGVGKTTLCRTLLDLQERKSRAALVGNALLSPDDLLRLMLQDLGALPAEELRQGTLQAASPTNVTTLPRIDPRFSWKVKISARIWHGCSSSVRALIVGIPDNSANSTTSLCAKVRIIAPFTNRPKTRAVSLIGSPRPS